MVILGAKADSVEYGALHVEALLIKTSAQSASKQTLDAVAGEAPSLVSASFELEARLTGTVGRTS